MRIAVQVPRKLYPRAFLPPQPSDPGAMREPPHGHEDTLVDLSQSRAPGRTRVKHVGIRNPWENDIRTHKILPPPLHCTLHEFGTYKGLTQSLDTINTTGQPPSVKLHAPICAASAHANTEGPGNRTDKVRRECLKGVERGRDASVVIF